MLVVYSKRPTWGDFYVHLYYVKLFFIFSSMAHFVVRKIKP